MKDAVSSAFDGRQSSRSQSELQALVRLVGKNGILHKETTHLQTVSKSGAGFRLSEECVTGRLVTLVVEMPREHRAYDLEERLYGVLGLVQHCTRVVEDGETYYNVGVAFVGRRVPESYKANPFQTYHVCGMTREGLWQIVETETPFRVRRHTRHWVRLNATLSVLRKNNQNAGKVSVTTREIGAGGASIYCDLDIEVGEKVKFAYEELDFYTVALVRNRRERQGVPFMLHLEFLDSKFPLGKLLEFVESTQIDREELRF